MLSTQSSTALLIVHTETALLGACFGFASRICHGSLGNALQASCKSVPVHPFAQRYVENQPDVDIQSPESIQMSFCPSVPFNAQQALNSASGLQGWNRPERVSIRYRGESSYLLPSSCPSRL
jgi:hypothetical protein